jgi:hypothetical protein
MSIEATSPTPPAADSLTDDASRSTVLPRVRFPRRVKLRRVRPLEFSWLHRTEVRRVADMVPPHVFDAYLATTIRSISPFYERAHVSMLFVPLTDLYPVSRVTEKRRMKQARRLIRLMQRRACARFEPCLLRYPRESHYRLVLPPLVERARQGYVVVDGVHRLTALAALSDDSAQALVVVVKGPRLPRPAAIPATLDAVRTMAYDPGRTFKFRRFRRELFRPAGATLRGDAFRFRSIEDFVAACNDLRRRSEKHS